MNAVVTSAPADWAVRGARLALASKVAQWATDLKDAVDHAETPHVSKELPGLANLVYFNIALDGAGALLPRTMGAVITRFAGPLWLLNAASTGFERAYRSHAAEVNDKLSTHFRNARDDFKDLINLASDDFFQSTSPGRALWVELSALLERPEVVRHLGGTNDRSRDSYRVGEAADIGVDIIREAGIFPGNREMTRWAQESFGKTLKKIQQLYLHSPLHRRGLSDLGGPAKGEVYVVDGHGVRAFPTLGEAGRVCLDRQYDWTIIHRWLGLDPCLRSVPGHRITSKADFFFLIQNGWLFKVEVERGMALVDGAPLRVNHLAIVPLEGASRRAAINLPATLEALRGGYRRVTGHA